MSELLQAHPKLSWLYVGQRVMVKYLRGEEYAREYARQVEMHGESFAKRWGPNSDMRRGHLVTGIGEAHPDIEGSVRVDLRIAGTQKTAWNWSHHLAPHWQHWRPFKAKVPAYLCPVRECGSTTLRTGWPGHPKETLECQENNRHPHQWIEQDIQSDHGKEALCPECGWTGMLAHCQRISTDEILARWPRLCAHVICCSLGYATPLVAARIVADARMGHENFCEWVYSCYARDPRVPVELAIAQRRHHSGPMAEYDYAIQLVRAVIKHGESNGMMASWF